MRLIPDWYDRSENWADKKAPRRADASDSWLIWGYKGGRMADGAAGVSYFIAKKKSRDNISLILSSILFFLYKFVVDSWQDICFCVY